MDIATMGHLRTSTRSIRRRLDLGVLLGTLLVAALLSAYAPSAYGQSADEKAIRELNRRFGAAVRAKDISAIMALYVPDESLFVFDAIPPRQYVGAKAYRKDFEDFLALFPGPVEIEISDLAVTTTRTLAYAHRIDSWTLTDKTGARVKMVFRVTDVYRKISSKWLVVHEHVSWPVDPATGKADLLSTP